MEEGAGEADNNGNHVEDAEALLEALMHGVDVPDQGQNDARNVGHRVESLREHGRQNLVPWVAPSQAHHPARCLSQGLHVRS